MPRVKTVSVTYERKFNLGDYEMLHLGTTCWAELDPEDDPIETTQQLQQLAREAVRQEWRRLKKPSHESR